MSQEPLRPTIYLVLGDDATPDEVNDATINLVRELSRSDADSVEKLRSETTVDGVKGDPITIGAIALALSVAIAPEIIKLISSWMNRRNSNIISLKIKLGDDEIEFSTIATATPDEMEKLADRFAILLKKHQITNTDE